MTVDVNKIELTSDNISLFHYAFLETMYETWEVQCSIREEKDEKKVASLRKDRAAIIERAKEYLKRVMLIRDAYAKIYNANAEWKKMLDDRSKTDVCFWIDNFMWVYDPRLPNLGMPAYTPMVLWPKQRELIKELQHSYENGSGLLLEKSRAYGATELCVGFNIHHWLFVPGYKATWGSRNAVLVDDKMRPDSIFPRLRRVIYWLPRMMKPKGYDKQNNEFDNFMKIYNPDNENTIVGEAGDTQGQGGRAQPLYSKVLTPNGYVEMGDINTGDTVIGGDGKFTNVTGIYPNGIKKIYRVTFNDKTFVDCCDDHLWKVVSQKNRKAMRYVTPKINSESGHIGVYRNKKKWEVKFKVDKKYLKFGYYNTIEEAAIVADRERKIHVKRAATSQVVKLSEIRKTLFTNKEKNWHEYSIPMTSPIEFEKKNLSIDPYVLGCLLGDGGLSQIHHSSIGYTSADDEMISLISERIPKNYKLRKVSEYGYCLIQTDHIKGTGSSKFKDWIRSLGLSGKLSHNKFIPDSYKFSNVNDRLEILRGLLDTDGWINTRGKNKKSCKICYCSTSPRLIADVSFTVHSLGGICTVYERPANERVFPDGKLRKCRNSYNLTISLPNGMCPFKMKRKAEKYRARSEYKVKRHIVDIKYIGDFEAKCITVDNKDGLYLTDNCTVTHNSSQYFVDEFAKVEHQEMVDTAISGNSNSRVYISTPEGQNYFYQLRQSGRMKVFPCWWYHDPAKNPKWKKAIRPEHSWWYEYQCRESHPLVIASQIDIKYEGSTEGAFIDPKWVEAAVNFNLAPEGVSAGGYDIAAGGENKGVYTHRIGPVVFPQKTIETKNLVLSFWIAIEEGEKDGICILNYDLAGIGKSAHDLKENSDRKFLFPVNGILGQSPPSKEYISSEGRYEKEKFKNRRAILWQKVADRFERTYEHVNKIRLYSADELISIPDDSNLKIQLSSVKRLHTDNGKIIAESKQDMRSRGVMSPDSADSLVYAFAEENDNNILKNLNYTASSKHVVKNVVDPATEAGDTYVSVVIDKMNTAIIALKWNPMTGTAKVFYERESTEPVDRLVARVKIACKENIRPIRQWIANHDAMPTSNDTSKSIYYEYYKNKAFLTENYSFDLYAAISYLEKMLQTNDIQISDGCDELILQLATWQTRGGAPMEGLGLATALCQVIQLLVKSNKALERKLQKEYNELVYYDKEGNRHVAKKLQKNEELNR